MFEKLTYLSFSLKIKFLIFVNNVISKILHIILFNKLPLVSLRTPFKLFFLSSLKCLFNGKAFFLNTPVTQNFGKIFCRVVGENSQSQVNNPMISEPGKNLNFIFVPTLSPKLSRF